MAITQVGTHIISLDSDTLDLSTLPGGLDDHVFVFAHKDGSDVFTTDPTAEGFTEIDQFGSSTGDDRVFGAWYKHVSDPLDPLPTVTCDRSGQTTRAIIGFLLRGVDTSTPLDGVTPVRHNQTNTYVPDPPSITTATDNAHVLVGSLITRDGAPLISVSAGYTNLGHHAGSGPGRPLIALLSPAVTPAGVEDPGVITFTDVGSDPEATSMSAVLRAAAAPSSPSFAATAASVANPASIRS